MTSIYIYIFFYKQTETVDGETIYSAIIQVVKFIYNSLCFQNGPWMRCFGRLTWPRMSELIIANFLSKVCSQLLFSLLLQLFLA